MKAYELYLLDPVKGNELLGILPERRNDPFRITQKSVMNWVKTVFGNSLSKKDIYYIEVTINEDRGNIIHVIPFLVTQKKLIK